MNVRRPTPCKHTADGTPCRYAAAAGQGGYCAPHAEANPAAVRDALALAYLRSLLILHAAELARGTLALEPDDFPGRLTAIQREAMEAQQEEHKETAVRLRTVLDFASEASAAELNAAADAFFATRGEWRTLRTIALPRLAPRGQRVR